MSSLQSLYHIIEAARDDDTHIVRDVGAMQQVS